MGCRFRFGLKNRLVAANYRGGFSMSRLSAVLKDKSQQCQNEDSTKKTALLPIRRPPQKFTSNSLKKTPLHVILWVRRQPPTRWVACWCLARKPPRQTCKVLGRFFYVRDYFLFWKMNVSNATIKIPKDIKSWKLKYTIDITSIPKNFGNATLQHGRLA